MNASHLFCFAAKSLQSYIMRGGKLRDMVGATSLIDKLSDKEQLRKWLTENFGIATDRFEILQAAAGSARIKFFDDEGANTVNSLWPLWCHAWAPDLEVVQHLEPWQEDKTYAEVAAEAGRRLERNRNFSAPRLPEAGPFAQRAPRTGEPAVWKDHSADDELVDLAGKRKRKEREDLGKSLPAIAEAFGFNANQLPNDFEDVSGGEGAYLAVIHADGNLLGQMFLNVSRAMEEAQAAGLKNEDAIALFQFLSEDVVANGTREAVRTAMAELKKTIERILAKRKLQGDDPSDAWPLAPLVLAGDDVTVVCRADLGLPFAEAFLKAFATEMEKRLGWLLKDQFASDECKKDCKNAADHKGLWGKLPQRLQAAIPARLTAGAGVVFCTDHYPFSLAYELCESVSKHAKNAAKAKAGEGNTPSSALSFVRIAGASAPTEFDDVLDGILKGADGTVLTGCPYFVGGAEKPQYADLLAVFEQARPHPDPAHKRKLGLPSGSLRDLLNLQRTDSDPDLHQVREAVVRMKEVAGGFENDTKRSKAWKEFESAWMKLCGWLAEESEAPPASREAAQQQQPHHRQEPQRHLGVARTGERPDQDWRDLRFYDASGTAEPGTRKRSPLLDLLTLFVVRDKDADNPAAEAAPSAHLEPVKS